MQEIIPTILYAVGQNPLLDLGLWLVSASLLLVSYIKHKMIELGYATVHLFPHPGDWELATHYLEIRSNHGWSPWPVYLMWPCLAAGVLMLLVGLFT
jgi:hypothetical protein